MYVGYLEGGETCSYRNDAIRTLHSPHRRMDRISQQRFRWNYCGLKGYTRISLFRGTAPPVPLNLGGLAELSPKQKYSGVPILNKFTQHCAFTRNYSQINVGAQNFWRPIWKWSWFSVIICADLGLCKSKNSFIVTMQSFIESMWENSDRAHGKSSVL